VTANEYEPRPLTFEMLAEGARRLAETVADPNPVEFCHPSDPRLVTAEHFNVLKHPRFPCGAPTSIEAAWKPRVHQVTCAGCLRALRDRALAEMASGPIAKCSYCGAPGQRIGTRCEYCQVAVSR
jgi:hypothetical protein